VEEVRKVYGGHGGCVDAEGGVAVVGYAAKEMLLQWVLGYACSGGDSRLIVISHVRTVRYQVWTGRRWDRKGGLRFGISQSVTSRNI
jgi:hypothetical protein